MFKDFCEFVKVTNHRDAKDFDSFMTIYGGKTFLNGIYRVHQISDIEKWTNIVCEAFPAYKGRIKVFGFDWLGRSFALDTIRNTVLLFEPGTKEVLDIPANFVDFHNIEIAEYHEDSLASKFFYKWFETNNGFVLAHNQCAGYKVPLSLNGDDSLENLEVTDMEVYWGLMAQL